VSHLIEVAFRGNRKEFFSWDGDTPPALPCDAPPDASTTDPLVPLVDAPEYTLTCPCCSR
jgi:hypothetical protein